MILAEPYAAVGEPDNARHQLERADYYIDRLTSLPPAPTVATELLELFSNPNQDLERIVELIRYDPSLTAKILKKCNSVHFSGEEPATDIFQVVMRLGFYEVYCVVAALVAASAFSLVKSDGGLDLNRLWLHSATAAVVASQIAKHVKEPPAIAFTAGLLHDIGKLIYASVESSTYARLVQENDGFGNDFGRAEQAAFGLSHAHLGARLLTRWDLPVKIVAAVQLHHDPASPAETADRLAAIVRLANNQAHLISSAEPQSPEALALGAEARSQLGLTDEDMPDLLAQTQAELEQFQGFITL